MKNFQKGGDNTVGSSAGNQESLEGPAKEAPAKTTQTFPIGN